MSIDVLWVVLPIAACAVCIIALWRYLYTFPVSPSTKHKKREEDLERGHSLFKNEGHRFDDGFCPPIEVRPIAIRAQYGRAGKAGLFQVAFATTGSKRFYWLTAPEIVLRCQRHSLKVPFVVGSDKDVPGTTLLDLGDDLLVK